MTIDRHAAAQATHDVPSIPRDAEGPVFREPWEAHAFAMALALHERNYSHGRNGRQRWHGKFNRPSSPVTLTRVILITGIGLPRWRK